MSQDLLPQTPMISLDEFLERIDSLVPDDIQEQLNRELECNPSIIDIINIQERARVLTIKQLISSTHSWTKAHVVNDDGTHEDCFWCDKCNIRCSTFEHISCLSIISKVKDKRPTYTTHNTYLMLMCSEVMNMDSPNTYRHCVHCGVPERAKTEKCEILEC